MTFLFYSAPLPLHAEIPHLVVVPAEQAQTRPVAQEHFEDATKYVPFHSIGGTGKQHKVKWTQVSFEHPHPVNRSKIENIC